ncbi:MAG TPA: NAD(P)/FAD-dependent oxidoreductase [Gammaproteobacteria bacterium]|nr:NAD(P)/FAD-dependent oxidoreductase [Gammaproteobacteria bacterium]
MTQNHFNVIVVGAGISGIGAGYYLQKKCPNKSFVILEGRDNIGGTWDLFRYPGIRSDSDMNTMGFRFKPWMGVKSIADGPSILSYLHETVKENDLNKKIHFNQWVNEASWSSRDSQWTVQVENKKTQELQDFTCDFLFLCGGYYNYEEGYTPHFAGREIFLGQIIHPQKWPKNLDYKNKKVVVIGSGATAVTIIPTMAEEAAHVTMLQRSPTYFLSAPDEDPVGNFLRKFISSKLTYKLVRWKNIRFQWWFFQKCRKFPKKVKEFLIKQVREELGPNYDIETHFTPKYNPWEQRMCLVPNGDFFNAINAGKASVITDHIDRFTKKGIKLKSGGEVEADLIVTATGLNLEVCNGIKLEVDNNEVDISKTMTYKGMMFSDVPNLVATFGYTNASWTLRADLTSEYVCRLLNFMDKKGYANCCPRTAEHVEPEGDWLDFTSGYVKRSMHKFPKQGSRDPWRNTQNFPKDVLAIRWGNIDNKELKFTSLEN